MVSTMAVKKKRTSEFPSRAKQGMCVITEASLTRARFGRRKHPFSTFLHRLLCIGKKWYQKERFLIPRSHRPIPTSLAVQLFLKSPTMISFLIPNLIQKPDQPRKKAVNPSDSLAPLEMQPKATARSKRIIMVSIIPSLNLIHPSSFLNNYKNVVNLSNKKNKKSTTSVATESMLDLGLIRRGALGSNVRQALIRELQVLLEGD